MSRPWHIWSIFGVCLAVLLAAIGWVSLTAVRLDRAQQETAQQEVRSGQADEGDELIEHLTRAASAPAAISGG